MERATESSKDILQAQPAALSLLQALLRGLGPGMHGPLRGGQSLFRSRADEFSVSQERAEVCAEHGSTMLQPSLCLFPQCMSWAM